ncbi:MAG: SPO1 DNA polymerase [Betaproteobacteria bacterium RBG_16_58_11]|nr:MAG: SPO1 DNA polymerase [Betaproteobacteria bacterium RBG_16_58_11]OGA00053.1 MAG: SPO1 DNA polymerase [Betaproteobacteria bacterium RBG_19FT_COMBO_58_11]
MFSAACTDCPRLSNFLAQVRISHPDYFAQPVPPFGVDAPRLLIVGLAPGMHGANRTGRPFTGDFAGILLYDTLHRYGFASRPASEHAADGLELIDCRITNAVKCLPPENKPDTNEIKICNKYLSEELKVLDKYTAVLALGLIAHKAVLMALGLKQGNYAFGHAAEHRLPNGLSLFDSYHCSRYNTQTKRLTHAMFHAVFERIRDKIDSKNTGEPRTNTDEHG